MVMPFVNKARSLTKDFSYIAATSGGFTVDEYIFLSDVTPRLHKINKPFFFLSSIDDPFFGSSCIPYDRCYDQILIGVTKHGGHAGWMEGKLLPTGCWWTKPCVEFLQYFNKKNRLSLK